MKRKGYLSIFKEFLFSIFSLLLVIVFSSLFLLPKIGQIREAKLDIEEQEKRITRLNRKLADLQGLSEAELLGATELLLEALPPQKDFYKILALIKKIFADNGAVIKSFNFVPGKVSTQSAQLKEKLTDSNQMIMTISFSSSSDNFGNLLSSLNKVLPLVEVDSIKFNSISSESDGTLFGLEGEMKIKSYFAPLPKMMGQVDSPLPKISNKDKELIEELKTYQRYQPEISLITTEPVILGKENPFP